MKHIIKIFLLLTLFSLTKGYSQTSANLIPASKISVTNVTGSDPYNFTIIVQDDLSKFTLADFVANDSIYLIDGSDLLIYKIVSKAGNVVTVDDVNNTGINPPTGQGMIVHPTANFKFPTYVSGLRDDLRSMVMNRFSIRVDEEIYKAKEITKYAGATPPAFSPLAGEPTVAQNGVGELYVWNGTVWNIVGGSTGNTHTVSATAPTYSPKQVGDIWEDVSVSSSKPTILTKVWTGSTWYTITGSSQSAFSYNSLTGELGLSINGQVSDNTATLYSIAYQNISSNSNTEVSRRTKVLVDATAGNMGLGLSSTHLEGDEVVVTRTDNSPFTLSVIDNNTSALVASMSGKITQTFIKTSTGWVTGL